MKKIIVLLSALGVMLCSCSKEEAKLQVSPTTISECVGASIRLTSNNENTSYQSNDEFYASVNEYGVVNTNKVGKTEIVATSGWQTATIYVTVNAAYHLYPELDEYVGIGKSRLIELLGSDYKEIESEGVRGIIYNYAENVTLVFIMDGVSVKYCSALVSIAKTTTLTEYLKERYTVVGYDGDYFYFLNHDQDVAIALEVYSSKYLMVAYTSYNSKSSSVMPHFPADIL